MTDRADWTWFHSEDAPWWSPEGVYRDLTGGKIAECDVLPRLARGEITYGNDWRDRFEVPGQWLLDDDPGVKQLPISTSHRWVEALIEEVELRDRANALSNLLNQQEQPAREISMAVIAFEADPWTPNGWSSRLVMPFVNAGTGKGAWRETALDIADCMVDGLVRQIPSAIIAAVYYSGVQGEVTAVYLPPQPNRPDPAPGFSDRELARQSLDHVARFGTVRKPEPSESGDAGSVEGMFNHTTANLSLPFDLDWSTFTGLG